MVMRRLPVGSGFSTVDQTSDPAAYVRRLDTTGAHPFWQAVKRRTIALLDVHAGDHVLDIGCGTGDDVQALAQVVGQAGRAVGVDNSATMIAEAWKRAESAGLPVAFYQGDACRLDFPDGCFDACRAERILQHLDDPRQAVSEMVRVARPGARIVVVEPDYGTLVVKGGDPTVSRKILHHRRDHFRSGQIGRQLPRMCKERGLTHLTVMLLTTASTDIAQGDNRHALHKYIADARAAGVVSEAEGTTWLADLEAAAAAGRYRHAVSVFLVSGRVP